MNKAPPTFTNYEDASAYQLDEWLAGRPWHNPFLPGATEPSYNKGDGECCPDFSCCTGNIAPLEQRRAFCRAGDEDRQRMLIGFLGSVIENHSREKAYIAGDPDVEKSVRPS